MNKKKLVLQGFLFFLASLTIFLCSIFVLNNITLNEANNNLNNYYQITSKLYNENENYNEIENIFNDNKDIHVTILNNDLKVVYDNFLNTTISEEESLNIKSHINKDTYYEVNLKNNEEYLYLVKNKNINNSIIRVGIKKSYVFQYNLLISILGLVILVALNIGFILYIYFKTNKNIKIINNEINSLNKFLGNNENINNLSIVDTLKETNLLIEEKIKEVNSEKEKYEYILNNISEGFIAINSNFEIKVINNSALKMFKKEVKSVLNKHISYLFDTSLLLKKISGLKDKIVYEEEINDSYYQFEINKINFNENNIYSILIIDLSEEKNSNQMKKQFFLNASHELKSPLTSIIGYSELISEGLVRDEEIIQISKKTLKEARRMKNIVLDMLELSKLESNESKLQENINLKEIIDSSIELLEYQINKKEITIIKDVSDYNIYANKEDINKLVSNILSNAVNYNVQKGNIWITLKNNKLTIKDSGIGISKEDLPRVFERFYRVDQGRSKENSGTGLGLAIVKHICLNYGYQISVDSKLNIGTTFKIIFKK